MKKLFVLGVTAVCVLGVTGCKKKGGDAVDSTKAQLRVATFDGGVGDQWLKNAARLFEEKNAERTDYQEGRTGVQIHVTSNRACSGGNLAESLTLNDDMYFTESVDYYKLTNQHKLADITDILTTPNEEDGGKKIIDKVDANMAAFMNREGKYYAVPFYDCFYGLVYDKDLFKQKQFYLKADGVTFTSLESEFGPGPNGILGDWDDGLPQTYVQFQKMMEKMLAAQVTPFTYSSGVATWYTARALTSWWSDDEGYEQTNLNYNFNGTATNIYDHFEGDVIKTKTVNISKENGYVLRSQAGLYNALYFARNILINNSSNYQAFNSNYDVQDAFVNSKYEGGSVKPIAMMFEGTWWENEAAPAFEEAESMGVSSFNYGFMPIPKSDASKIGDATLLNLNDSYGFINANCENMQLAKDFFKFLHSDEMMREFTKTTNMTRGLDYTFAESDFDKITTYAQDLVSIKNSSHVKVVYPNSGLEFFINNGSTFSSKAWPWDTKNYSDNPIIKFIDDKSVSAKDYFLDHASFISESEWATIIN